MTSQIIRVRHVVCLGYVTSCRSTMEWFWGQFLIWRIRKNYSRAVESARTSNRSDRSLGSKILISFLLVPALSSAREQFFLILHIKNYPQNHSILSRSKVTYPVLIFTCRTLDHMTHTLYFKNIAIIQPTQFFEMSQRPRVACGT